MQRFFTVPALVMVFLLVAAIVAGCTAPPPAATPPPKVEVKKWKEIPIPIIQDLTGPYSAATLPSVNSANDFEKWLNANGGIDGVPIKFDWQDTRGDKAAYVTAYNKIREGKPLLVGIGSFPDLVASRLAEDKILGLSVTVPTATVWPPSWLWGMTGIYPDVSGLELDYISSEWAKTGKTEKCKVAFFTPDMYVGRDSTSAEVMEYAKTKSNIEIVAVEYFDYASVDLSSDVLRIMQKNPDYLVGFYFMKSGAAFYKALDANGFVGKVKVINGVWGMQSENAKLVEPKLIEGVTGPYNVPLVRPIGEKQINAGMEWAAKDLFSANNNPAGYWGGTYMSGVQNWCLLEEAFKRAVKNVGWDKLDSTACHEALQGIRDVELHNLYHWGAAQGTRYTNKYQIFKFVNGKHELASDKWWSAPDVRPAKFRTAEYNWSGAGWPAGYFKQ